jgi:aminopeptidase YwaD
MAVAQKRGKKTKKTEESKVELASIVSNLQKHIKILASDSLEGRRTGTQGEQLAASYIKNQFTEIKADPKGENGGFFQTFEIKEGKEFESHSTFVIGESNLAANKDFFPLNSSANSDINEIVSPILKDPKTTWFLDLKDELVKNQSNPHYDITDYVKAQIKEYVEKGASGIIIYNGSDKLNDNLQFDKRANVETAKIPVVYITKEAFKKHIKTKDAVLEIKLHIEIKEQKRNGTNVIAGINNKAENTIVLGAHYDHLGYGEDKNSLHTGTRMIHNGADDNASGVAALIELCRILKSSSYKNYNYVFIAFSGEELGLYGSKYYTEHATIDIQKVDYMINMDMVGRLNDSTATFTIGGFGTSPTWAEIINTTDKWNTLQVKIDSSGTGPSDHSSFYRKDIPVLFFFTGTHKDYHKPSDDYEKINFGGEEKIVNYIINIIKSTNDKPKLAFTKTRENSSTSSNTRFTVSLGIMPDYTFSGTGVRADGISEGKLAQKIGLKAGDIVTKLGDYNITSVENYMKALGQFKKGDSTKLVTQRAGKEIIYDVTF